MSKQKKSRTGPQFFIIVYILEKLADRTDQTLKTSFNKNCYKNNLPYRFFKEYAERVHDGNTSSNVF